MVRSLIHNPRRRGLVGALLFASVPDLVGIWFGGLSFVFTTDYTTGDFFLIVFFAIVGFALFHGGQGRPNGGHYLATDWTDYDRDQHDFIAQEGAYAQMRDQWDPNYMRDKY